jgi:hypothetical protein
MSEDDEKPTLEQPTLEHPTLERPALPRVDPLAAAASTGDRATIDGDLPRPTLDDAALDRATVALEEDADRSDEDDDAGDPSERAPEVVKKTLKAGTYVFVGLLLFAALAGPLVFYFFFFRYKPTATYHVPDNAQLALRLDTRALYGYEPFRKEVLGTLDIESEDGRRAAFKKHTGIDLAGDVREVVVASMDGKSYVVLFGGYFQKLRRGTFAGGLKAFADEVGVQGGTLEGQGTFVLPAGLRVSQSDDSTVVVASDARALAAALPTDDEPAVLGLPNSGAMSFAVGAAVLDRAAAASDTPPLVADVAAHTASLTGYLTLGRRNKIYVELLPKKVGAEELATKVEAARVFMAESGGTLVPASVATLLRDGKAKSRAESAMFEVEVTDATLAEAFRTLSALAIASLAVSSTP